MTTIDRSIWENIVEPYIEYLYALGLSEQTVRVYVRCVERFIAWCVDEQEPAGAASALVLAQYAQSIPQTASSRRQHRVALRHWFDAAGRPDAPVSAIRVPPKKRYVSRALEPEEATRLVEVSRGWWPDGTAMLLGLYLGLRRAEIAGARWDRFTTDGWYRVFGKFGVEANLPVHRVLADELTGRATMYPWLFPGRTSAHVGATTVGAWCERVGREAGIEGLSPHRLRHTAIATINDETGDLRATQEFARHADPATTRIYTRVTAQRLVRAVEALRYVA
ncbi:MAG: hypothetical protein DWP92_00250 [Armatimonadetes bacterium]|nr:MAG: hypothetical protein DWP92_00250 [Armatimonadota bacterium]